MKTIDIILKEAGYTKKYLLDCRASWITNWMWAKWWIQFTDVARKFAFAKKPKIAKFLDDLDLVSDIHDLNYLNWETFKDFFKANMELISRVLQLMWWTSTSRRLIVFIMMFTTLNTIWWKAFKKSWKSK